MTPSSASSLRLDFMGIGAPKAATTWLTNLLASHPALFIPEIKETHFFAYPFEDTPFSTYERFFTAALPSQLKGEFSVDYLSHPATPARVRSLFPDLKIIVSFRNPIDQIYSNYWHALRQGFNCRDDSQPDFETALQRHADTLLEPTFYGTHLERWLLHFPREQFLILFHDDIVQDSEAVAQSLWSFLDVPAPPEDATTGKPQQDSSSRKGVSLRSGRSARLYNRLYFWTNTYVLRPLSKRFGYDAAFKLIHVLRLRQIGEKLFFRSGYPKMSDSQRELIRARLQPEVDHLARLTGRDLSHWR